MAFTTGQAGNQIQQLANIPTEHSADIQELNRAQRLAQLLSSQPVAEGQMVSGRFVAPSWTQHLAGLVNAGAGAYYANQAEEKQSKLAEKLREERLGTQQGIMDAISKGDTKAALAIASSRPEYGKEFIAPLMANVIPKAQEPKVVGNNLVGPDGKVIFTAPKEFAPHAPQMVQTENGMMMFDPNTRSFSPAMVDGKQIMPPMDSGAKSDLRDNQRQLKAVSGGLKAVQDTPKAFGWGRGAAGTVLGESLANKGESEAETQNRSYVFNVVSKVIHDRAGASQTPSEIAKINRFLPNEYDNAKAIENKLKGFQKFLQDEAESIRTPSGNVATPTIPTPNKPATPATEDGKGKGRWEYRTFEGKQQRRWVAE